MDAWNRMEGLGPESVGGVLENQQGLLKEDNWKHQGVGVKKDDSGLPTAVTGIGRSTMKPREKGIQEEGTQPLC